jgi:hypothetical protein
LHKLPAGDILPVEVDVVNGTFVDHSSDLTPEGAPRLQGMLKESSETTITVHRSDLGQPFALNAYQVGQGGTLSTDADNFLLPAEPPSELMTK